MSDPLPLNYSPKTMSYMFLLRLSHETLESQMYCCILCLSEKIGKNQNVYHFILILQCFDEHPLVRWFNPRKRNGICLYETNNKLMPIMQHETILLVIVKPSVKKHGSKTKCGTYRVKIVIRCNATVFCIAESSSNSEAVQESPEKSSK